MMMMFHNYYNNVVKRKQHRINSKIGTANEKEKSVESGSLCTFSLAYTNKPISNLSHVVERAIVNYGF